MSDFELRPRTVITSYSIHYTKLYDINNVRVEQFPDAVIARLFNFEIKPLLEFSTAEKADVDMKQLFG